MVDAIENGGDGGGKGEGVTWAINDRDNGHDIVTSQSQQETGVDVVGDDGGRALAPLPRFAVEHDRGGNHTNNYRNQSVALDGKQEAAPALVRAHKNLDVNVSDRSDRTSDSGADSNSMWSCYSEDSSSSDGLLSHNSESADSRNVTSRWGKKESTEKKAPGKRSWKQLIASNFLSRRKIDDDCTPDGDGATENDDNTDHHTRGNEEIFIAREPEFQSQSTAETAMRSDVTPFARASSMPSRHKAISSSRLLLHHQQNYANLLRKYQRGQSREQQLLNTIARLQGNLKQQMEDSCRSHEAAVVCKYCSHTSTTSGVASNMQQTAECDTTQYQQDENERLAADNQKLATQISALEVEIRRSFKMVRDLQEIHASELDHVKASYGNDISRIRQEAAVETGELISLALERQAEELRKRYDKNNDDAHSAPLEKQPTHEAEKRTDSAHVSEFEVLKDEFHAKCLELERVQSEAEQLRSEHSEELERIKKDIVAKHNSEVDRLRRELEEQKQSFEQRTHEPRSLNIISELDRRKSEADAKHEEDMNSLREQMESEMEASASALAEILLNEANAKKEEEVNVIRCDMEDMMQRLSSLHNTEIKELKAEFLQSSNEQCNSHATELESLRVELQSQHQKEMNSLVNEHITALDHQKQNLLSAHESKLEEVKEDIIATHSREIDSLRQATADEQNQSLERQRNELQNLHVTDIEQVRIDCDAKYEAEMTRMRDELMGAMESKIENLSRMHSEELAEQKRELELAHSARLEVNEAIRRDMDEEIRRLRQVTSSHTKYVKDLKSKLQSSNEQCSKAQSRHEKEVTSVREAMDEKMRELSELHVTELEKQKSDHAGVVKTLRVEARSWARAKQQGEIDSLRREMEERTREQEVSHAAALEAQKIELEAAHSTDIARIQIERQEIDTLRTQTEEMTKQLSLLKTSHARELEEQKAELDLLRLGDIERVQTEAMNKQQAAIECLRQVMEASSDRVLEEKMEQLSASHAREIKSLREELHSYARQPPRRSSSGVDPHENSFHTQQTIFHDCNEVESPSSTAKGTAGGAKAGGRAVTAVLKPKPRFRNDCVEFFDRGQPSRGDKKVSSENDVDDLSFYIGKDEGFISSKSVSESDISETASEESEEKIDSTLIDDCSETCSMDYTDDVNGMECNSEKANIFSQWQSSATFYNHSLPGASRTVWPRISTIMTNNHGDHQNRRIVDSTTAFGGKNISPEFRAQINQIRSDDPALTEFRLSSADAGVFSDEGWELLGRYITKNTHLTYLNLSHLCRGDLTDSRMSILFNNLTGSRSLTKLNLSSNDFGLCGVQSMVHFLRNCPNFIALDLSYNHNINTDCFRGVVAALSGSSVEELFFGSCGIDDITALANFTLPDLRRIYLWENNIRSIPSLESYTGLQELLLRDNQIGNEGCREMAKLLANKSSSLETLCLQNNSINGEGAEVIASSLKHNTTLETLILSDNDIRCRGIAMLLANKSSSLKTLGLRRAGIDDEGTKIIANSLTHNTRLETLDLTRNEITDRGSRGFLKLLNDVSSIEGTYKSNHTLRFITFPIKTEMLKKHIKSALEINRRNEGNSHAAGRAKITATHLNSVSRRELCHLQGIEYSYNTIFAGIDPVLLPDFLSMASREQYGLNDLYRMLIAKWGLISSL